MQRLDDSLLIKQFLAGDTFAYGKLIEKYRDQLWNTIFYLIRDRSLSDDLFQELCIRIMQAIRNNNYSEEKKFPAWASNIARNMCIDHFRKAKKRSNVSIPDRDVFDVFGFSSNSKEDSIITDETNAEIYKILAELPEVQRDVVILRYYAGLSFREICKIQNVSVNTSLGRMRYALKNIRIKYFEITENE